MQMQIVKKVITIHC